MPHKLLAFELFLGAEPVVGRESYVDPSRRADASLAGVEIDGHESRRWREAP